MKESYLHYIWQTRQFDCTDLTTMDGASVRILKPGYPHADAGPDFRNATVTIQEQMWVGHVEIHIKSSDWFAHNHHLDISYDTTILHVVYAHDQEVKRTDGTVIPCIELKNRMSLEKYKTFEALTNNSNKIPCDNMLPDVLDETKTLTLEAMAIARVVEKSEAIKHLLIVHKNDWQFVLHISIARAFGMRINAEPFQHLAKMLHPNMVAKYRKKPNTIEAICFGVAGFLHPMLRDPYPKSLANEFGFFKHKHGLDEMDASQWNFLRLRPANFPTIRIAQFAAVLQNTDNLFNRLLGDLRYNTVLSVLDVALPDYWTNHYRFDELSKEKPKKIGKGLMHSVIINAIVPVFYTYGRAQNNLQLQDKCLELLQSTPPEQNRITRYFSSRNTSIETALQSQGVLHLHQKFCNFKLCLKCQIGHEVLKHAT